METLFKFGLPLWLFMFIILCLFIKSRETTPKCLIANAKNLADMKINFINAKREEERKNFYATFS